MLERFRRWLRCFIWGHWNELIVDQKARRVYLKCIRCKQQSIGW